MSAKMSRILLLVLAMTTSVAFAKEPATISLGRIASEGLSFAQAEQVFIASMKHLGYKLENPGMFIEDMPDKNGKPSLPGYFGFNLKYSEPGAFTLQGSGWFAVSVFTGDVLKIYPCERIVFPALQHLQEHIMKQTGKTMDDEKAQRKGLDCMDED
jgi:hypothetical protein